MTDARDGSSRTIRQFHFTAWPEETEVPRQADYFIDLIGQVTAEICAINENFMTNRVAIFESLFLHFCDYS